ncbi:hypothetical protein JCM9279_007498 [Rhodotorula babjevae]
MAEHRLYVHGPTHEPFNPLALDEARALVDFPPDEALQAWYGEAAGTALQRYRDDQVTVHRVPKELYYDSEQRWTWKQDVLKVNDVSLGNAGQAHHGTFWAKIDNWFALVPLPLVLQAFDRLYDEPTPLNTDLRTHQVEAFARLLLSLGIDPAVTAAAASADRRKHLVQWLESNCSQAVQFWIALYTHVYHNARTAAGSTSWVTRLDRLDLGQGSAAWRTYLEHLETGLSTARLPGLFPRASTYMSNFVAPELLVSPVFTDLYLTLHSLKQRPPFQRVTSFGTSSSSLFPPLRSVTIAGPEYHPEPRSRAATESTSPSSPTSQPSQVRFVSFLSLLTLPLGRSLARLHAGV